MFSDIFDTFPGFVYDEKKDEKINWKYYSYILFKIIIYVACKLLNASQVSHETRSSCPEVFC